MAGGQGPSVSVRHCGPDPQPLLCYWRLLVQFAGVSWIRMPLLFIPRLLRTSYQGRSMRLRPRAAHRLYGHGLSVVSWECNACRCDFHAVTAVTCHVPTSPAHALMQVCTQVECRLVCVYGLLVMDADRKQVQLSSIPVFGCSTAHITAAGSGTAPGLV